MYVHCFQCPLRTKPVFQQKQEDEIAFIDEMKSDHLRLPVGAEFIRLEQSDAELYTLFSGWAFRYKELPDSRRQILNFALPGDLIGLQASLFDKSLYGVVALTEIELCVIPRRKILKLYERMPAVAYDLTWLCAETKALVDENLLTVGRRSAIERVAALIVSLYKRCEALGLARNGAFEFPLNQQHIADALGLSLVHTNKTIAKLRGQGLFSVAEGRMLIANLRALERLAQYHDVGDAPRPII